MLVVADDPGPISSQTEQDTRRFAAFAKVPVLDPATPEQAFDMIKAAFELSARYPEQFGRRGYYDPAYGADVRDYLVDAGAGESSSSGG